MIANHFLEHCQNPFGAPEYLARAGAGGILYIAVPDKRFTFDKDRPVTTIEHLLEHADYRGDVDRRAHFEEWGTAWTACGARRRWPRAWRR